MVKFFSIVVLTFLFSAMAVAEQEYESALPQQATPPATTHPSHPAKPQAKSQAVTKQGLLQRIGSDLNITYCGPKSPLLKRYAINTFECQAMMAKAQGECAKQILPKMPGQISDPKVAGKWGQEFGVCVGQKLVKMLPKPVAPHGAPHPTPGHAPQGVPSQQQPRTPTQEAVGL